MNVRKQKNMMGFSGVDGGLLEYIAGNDLPVAPFENRPVTGKAY